MIKEYVKERSRLARTFSKTTDLLVNYTILELHTLQGRDRDDLEKHLIIILTKLTATWNPAMWAILRILIPIIVRLVLEYWFTQSIEC